MIIYKKPRKAGSYQAIQNSTEIVQSKSTNSNRSTFLPIKDDFNEKNLKNKNKNDNSCTFFYFMIFTFLSLFWEV